jgi:hypothetical protein
VLGLPASTLPVSSESAPLRAEDAARALGALGYSGFAHLRQSRRVNPAELLLRTLRAPKVEARIVEALPWLLVNHLNLDWHWLLREAKVNDLQNRLGFVVTVAREVAERQGKSDAANVLRHWERVLENSRLANEDAFAQDPLGDAERTWLRSNRSKEAARWNLLTSLSVETVARSL